MDHNINETDIIDKELDELFDPWTKYKILYLIIDIFLYVVLSAAFISDVILIYTISANKLLRTKPHMLLIAWTVCNIYLVTRIVLEMLFRLTSNNEPETRYIVQLDFIMLFNHALFMFVLLVNKLSESAEVKLKYIFIVIIAINFIQSFTLFFDYFEWPLLNLLLIAIMHGITVLTLLIKECFLICCKKYAPESKSPFIMGVGRVCVYNLIIVVAIMFITSYLRIFFGEVFGMSIILTSFYVLIYMVTFDRHFKMCFKGIFTRNVLMYNVVVSMAVNDEDTVRLNV